MSGSLARCPAPKALLKDPESSNPGQGTNLLPKISFEKANRAGERRLEALVSAQMGKARIVLPFDIDLGWRVLLTLPWRLALTGTTKCNKIY